MKVFKTILITTALVLPLASFANIGSYSQAINNQDSNINTYGQAIDGQQAEVASRQDDCSSDVCVDVHSNDPTPRTDKMVAELDSNAGGVYNQ